MISFLKPRKQLIVFAVALALIVVTRYMGILPVYFTRRTESDNKARSIQT
mgnify:CR=1 FL=1